MIKMALENFRWFDTGPRYDPKGMEDYVSGKNNDYGYTPGQKGALSTLGTVLSGVGAAFAGDTKWLERQQARNQEEMQADLEFRAALQKQAIDNRTRMNTKTYTFNPLTGEYTMTGEVPKGSIVRNTIPLEQKVAQQQALDQAKGIPAADYGRFTLSNESIKNLEDVDKILFPNGDIKSFRRDIAGASNLPIFGGPAPFNEGAQKVYRKLGSALAARQLIQTGVSSNEGERKQLVNQFLANYGSDASSFREGLNQLGTFYKEYNNLYKTKGIGDNPTENKNKNVGGNSSGKLTKDNLFEGL